MNKPKEIQIFFKKKTQAQRLDERYKIREQSGALWLKARLKVFFFEFFYLTIFYFFYRYGNVWLKARLKVFLFEFFYLTIFFLSIWQCVAQSPPEGFFI
jgi:hypothetical protein